MLKSIQKILPFICLLTIIGCKKDQISQQENTLVPLVNVNTTVNSLAFISTPGDTWEIRQNGNSFQSGVGGIVIYNFGNGSFQAFDMACPYVNPSSCSKPMRFNSRTLELSCTDCIDDNITFTIPSITSKEINGKTYGLRRYSAFLEGNVLRIQNLR